MNPTLSTTAGPEVLLGNAVTDSATLGGTATQPADPVINLTGAAGPAAGGTIIFKLYGPSEPSEPPVCGPLVYTSPAVTVARNNTYNSPNPQFVPTEPGNYHWVAVYSGNLPNTNGVTHNAACTDTNEDVTVNTIASSLTSAQSWVPYDSVTITAPAGGGNLAGTVSFTLHASNNCTGAVIYGPTQIGVSGASPQTVSTSNTTAIMAPESSVGSAHLGSRLLPPLRRPAHHDASEFYIGDSDRAIGVVELLEEVIP